MTVLFVDIGGIFYHHCLYKYCHIGLSYKQWRSYTLLQLILEILFVSGFNSKTLSRRKQLLYKDYSTHSNESYNRLYIGDIVLEVKDEYPTRPLLHIKANKIHRRLQA